MSVLRFCLAKTKRAIFDFKYKYNFIHQEFHTTFVCDNYKGLSFGERTYIGPYCHFDAKGGIELQDYCIIAPHVKIWSYNHNFKDEMIPYGHDDVLKKVVVGKGAWIGLGSIILPGTTIGEGCIVGAGSVVTGNIPDFSIVRPQYSNFEPLSIDKQNNLYQRKI